MNKFKICMLGSYGVGKTSLVRRYVSGTFSERYLSTIGVKIDRKEIEVDGDPISLVLWDLHGHDEFQPVQASYLRGAAGYILVADGTRPQTLELLFSLSEFAKSVIGDVPFEVVINKADLRQWWNIADEIKEKFSSNGWTLHELSAKEGQGVDKLFEDLGRKILEKSKNS